MKRTIKLTESKLRGMIHEAVNEAVNEGAWSDGWNAIKQGVKGAVKGAGAGYNQGTSNFWGQQRVEKEGNYRKGIEDAERINSINAAYNTAKYIQRMNIQIDDNFINELNRVLNNLKRNGRL